MMIMSRPNQDILTWIPCDRVGVICQIMLFSGAVMDIFLSVMND